MRVLFVGDVVGKPGREMLRANLPALRRGEGLDLVLANGENAAGGVGITPAVAEELFGLGIAAITLGNHAWDKREILTYIDGEARLLRPLNFPGHPPGAGLAVIAAPGGERVGVVSLSGRVFSEVHYDCPFRSVETALEGPLAGVKVRIVDVHAEATSEKVALGWYLDGKVSAVVGTHTHVQTADERILPGGTGYLTDLGMTGPADSVIGISRELVLERFLTQLPVRFEVAKGRRQLNGVILEVDEATGRARSITRINIQE